MPGGDAHPIPPRTEDGVQYRQLPAGSPEARRLFAYRAAWAPPASPEEMGWGAWVKAGRSAADAATEERLVAALLVERSGATGMIHGPLVVEAEDPVEVAAQLLGAALFDASAKGMKTLFARPQGLDRVWVRFGFIPVPEAEAPCQLKGRPGAGLFAWRGGSALWSSRRPDALEPDDPR
ncbi:MAG: hypothetical protein HY724_03075 [Candidatus Rokubacteria bacterium]|nr:hypothetical protein [Candidatus Rokubacteria bacterium]